MCGFRRRMFKGSWLQLIVLRILYETPTHGYKLLEKVNTLMAGRRKLKPGSLYTILRRMEHSGLLNSIWEKIDNSRDHRTYNLTEKGFEMLRRGKTMIEDQQEVLNELAKFYKLHFVDE